MKDWSKKLAGIKTSDLKDDTKDAGWVQYLIVFLLLIPALCAMGLAGGLICYMCICMGASVGNITVTLYICIFILIALGLVFCAMGWITKAVYKKNKKAYRREIENRRNMSLKGQGNLNGYRQPQQQQYQQPQQQTCTTRS